MKNLKLFFIFAIAVMMFVAIMVGGAGVQSVASIGADGNVNTKITETNMLCNRTEINVMPHKIADSKTSAAINPQKIELLCLMYHNVVANGQKQGDYEVSESTLESDFAALKSMGYTCVSGKEIADICDNKRAGKYVMITFDDGFYGVYKYVPKLLEKYDFNCIVAVVGEFIDLAGSQDYKTRCSYMNSAEVAELAKNNRVEIALHSYDLHHIKNGRRGVKIKDGEPEEEYKKTFAADTRKIRTKLVQLGVSSDVYCYPLGEFCRQSESVLKEFGCKMTMTCAQKVNFLQGRKSLYLLGRINRSGKAKDLQNLITIACNQT